MKIAIMGTRGIPANYGGFETFAEELSTRLIKRGHEITVYCRSANYDYSKIGNVYKGVHLIVLPTIRHKYLDTVFHTFLSVFYEISQKHEIILICNSANSILSIIPKLMGKKVVINVDGLEWKRQKWNILGKYFYRFSEYMATILSHAIVSDAIEIKKYYSKKFGKETFFIPYGAPNQKIHTKDILKNYKLKPRAYILYVSRLEPENNAHRVIHAFEKIKTDMNLVIVGDAPYSTSYIRNLKKTKDKRIIFTGYVFGDGYQELQSNAYIYVQATEVGGTHPALLEGMGYGNCILANDVPEHREVLGDAGIFFSNRKDSDLAHKMQFLVDHRDIVEEYRQRSRNRALKNYSWEKITLDYEKLFGSLLKRKLRNEPNK